ncbi:MAG: amidohydrolase family protein [Sphaerochaetaceae bacterium]
MKMLDVLVKNCSILTGEMDIVESQCIGIIGNRIEVIAPIEEIEKVYTTRETVDGYGKIAMPGMVDAHMHTCQQLLRGGTADEYPMVWARILVPFEKSLDESDVYASARLCALEMIKSGTTGFAESGGPLIHAAAEAYLESGLRGRLAYSVMDQGESMPPSMKDSVDTLISRTEELYKQYHGSGNDRIQVYFGLRQILTCSSELIRITAERAKALNTGVHIHLEEHRDEVRYCLENFRMRPVEYLDSLGLLGPNLLAAHSVLMTDKEIRMVAEHKVNAVHCPRSNLGSHGFPRTPSLLEAGASVGLGTDGASGSNMDVFQEIKILRSAIRAAYGIPLFDPVALPAKSLLKMATQGGANALMMGDSLGVLEKGRVADIILINIDQPHLSPSLNYVNTIVDCVSGNDVSDSIIDGKIVMKDREVLVFDEAEILAEAKVHAASMKRKASL